LRGCTVEEQNEFGTRQGSFDGIIVGKSVSVGDGIHEGIWEDANVVVSDEMTGGGINGIRSNDENKWTKLSSSTILLSSSSTDGIRPIGKKAGEWILVIYVVFSLLAGCKELFVRLQKRLHR